VNNANDRFAGADSIGMTRYEEILISNMYCKEAVVFDTTQSILRHGASIYRAFRNSIFYPNMYTHTPLTHKPIEQMRDESSSTSS
jgi:hypothetical protein